MNALGSGLLLTILTPPALIMLSLTVIGIPLSLLALLLYLILLYTAKIVVSLAIARTFFSAASIGKATPLFETFVGVTVLHLLKLIPVAGHFILVSLPRGSALAQSIPHLKNKNKI